MKSFGSEALLLPTYLVMLAICIFLNFYGQTRLDLVNITVNAGMFIIVGVIILWSTYGALNPVSRMASELRYTIQTMEIDFKKTESYLWEKYRNETELFENRVLNQRFNEYRVERKRLMLLSDRGVKCDIEDYINEHFIDTHVKKGMISIVPGAMTGLGILGTFIGLSFGLQSFRTGTAREITSSIAPLMNGIKVAFHTSIYGMVFSLVFHFVYKKVLEDAYVAVDQFLDAFHKYVLPNTENDDLEMLLSLEEKQMNMIRKVLSEFSDELADKLVRVSRTMEPIAMPEESEISVERPNIIHAINQMQDMEETQKTNQILEEDSIHVIDPGLEVDSGQEIEELQGINVVQKIDSIENLNIVQENFTDIS